MSTNAQIVSHALHVIMERGGFASFFPPPVGGQTYDLKDVRYYKDAVVEIRYATPTQELEIHRRDIDEIVVKAKAGLVYDYKGSFSEIEQHFFSL